MKVTVNLAQPERKLVAVLGECGAGLFLPNYNGVGSTYIDGMGRAVSETKPLDKLLDERGVTRLRIYEGDTITLQF